jgi:hypothetical protein
MSRKSLSVILIVGVLALGVFTAAAQDDHILVSTDSGFQLIIADGRLNGLDISAPVAVYNTFTPTFDANGVPFNEPVGIQILRIDPVTSNGVPLFELTHDEVMDLMNSEDHMMTVDGYTLNYSADTNWFWVSAPADAEGKVYTFQWENVNFPVGEFDTTVTRDSEDTSAATTSTSDSAADLTDDDATATPAPVTP